MTLDPVHVDGIADLAGRVSRSVDERDHSDVANRAWAEFLDPLYDDGSEVLVPLGKHRKRQVKIEDIALEETGFATQHGLDAGTINPTTFNNGLVIDVSQAAMASVPSDVELHRGRTIVMTIHTNDDGVGIHDADWRLDDRGYARRRVLRAPRVDRYEQTVVHALALYRAESEHALEQADIVTDLLVLDGPIYPTGLLNWVDRDPELKRLIIEEAEFTGVIENYLELVETFVEREIPLVGFVKNSTAKALTRTLRKKTGAPWLDDDAFFRRVLSRPDEHGDPRTDALTFTGWFRSRLGVHGVLSGDTLSLDHDYRLPAEAYEVTFFVVYDPRDDLIYRVEAPYGVTRETDTRERLTRHLLSEIAAQRGPPLAVAKADTLASIGQDEKGTLRRRIEREFDTGQQRRYDDLRWGLEPDVDL
jgi:hypothetical protein